LIGRKFSELIPDRVRGDIVRRIESLAQHPRTETHEHEVVQADGSIGWQQWTNHALVDHQGRVIEMQGVGIDITERKRAAEALQASEAELRATYEQIRDLGGRLIAAQEEERARIARDLHDDLSQRLALLAIDIEQLGHSRKSADIAHRVGELASDIHNLSHRLHPSGLAVLGLVGAIGALCRDTKAQHGLDVQFEHDNVPEDLPSDVALCLFRIVQEAMHNTVKHSGAKHALVQLAVTGDQIDLHVADDGLGFEPALKSHQGLGLIGMRERVNFVGGKFVIHSSCGGGTRLGVRIPLSAPAGARRSSAGLA
jgi:signal transduction histidine kinase